MFTQTSIYTKSQKNHYVYSDINMYKVTKPFMFTQTPIYSHKTPIMSTLTSVYKSYPRG